MTIRRQLKPLVYLLSLLMLMAPVAHAFAASGMNQDQQMSLCHNDANKSAEQPCQHCPEQTPIAIHCACEVAVSAALIPGQNRPALLQRTDQSIPNLRTKAVHFGNFLPPFRPPKQSSV